MKYLFDADSIIDYLSGQPDVRALRSRLLRDDIALSGVTLIELFTGVYGARDPKTAERELRQFLRGVLVLPLNRRIILRTAQLRRDLLDRKLPIKHRAYDLITAATALVHGLTLVTSNVRDFQDIPSLVLLNPRAVR